VDVIADTELKPAQAKFKVVAYDFGMKTNILRLLRSHGCAVEVVPANDPGQGCPQIQTRRRLSEQRPRRPGRGNLRHRGGAGSAGQVPIFGICLGHQILALALGGTTYKLKFGHRGANHPVKNLDTGKSRSPARTTASAWIWIRSRTKKSS
jgi:carbamoyl-phosphate synthase small subunit